MSLNLLILHLISVNVLLLLPAGCPTAETVSEDLARHVRDTRSLPGRYVMRVLPVQHVCFVALDEIRAIAQKAAAQHFPEGEQWCDFWFSRCTAAGCCTAVRSGAHQLSRDRKVLGPDTPHFIAPPSPNANAMQPGQPSHLLSILSTGHVTS